ncbi:vWA domain-containing protein [Clostridium beijerinckii]|uniref:VWA domain-containing protein n=1 Tax=Clostridium beijerinckii TaxID=1520 RepID=A0AAW3WA63_CLOBE|nr:vWA domain-containing protein [Clostridium beijerinckii]MBC2455830.1 VWA domain-containing protein [Clostridium beijerinckii]MBC2475885.1 VWA domain-containing protein [Clostridium beijerinckii]MDG5852949.1 VWA domain-containing protein [Clostridium beijerinckii]NOV61780.1 Mg-chelatase subunit ChlD [Clostridium beijerinckii]NOV68724.1 Mg-chelatase subunit ChlD [Clostridium beijerinckii]
MKEFLKKYGRKAINWITIFTFSVTIFSFMSISLIKVKADLPIKPSFVVNINSATPNPAAANQDITISGTITPQDFETEIGSQKKEIVLVLDVSGSMINNDSTSNNSYTKISELKKAANNFINKMSSISNLKIGIVAFSDNGTINPTLKHHSSWWGNTSYDMTYSKSIDQIGYDSIPDYRCSGTDFLDASSTTDLSKMINGLEALGGTNTGEGLRKAEYMLENGDPDAEKTIVFMSDGMPTFYSVNESERNSSEAYTLYTTINNNNPNYAGDGYDTDSNNVTKSKDYAIKIGNIIRDTKKPKIFSIGYGLGNSSSRGNINMKDIHKAMGGTDDCFFATDSGAIDGVFNSIGDKIIQSYNINDLTMNMNFNSSDGFSLSDSGNTVKFDQIVYTGTKVNDKYLYKATQMSFSFVIKGSKVGQYNNVFGASNVTYTWNNTTLSGVVNQNNLSITIQSNVNQPYFEVKLNSATPNPSYLQQGSNGRITTGDITVTGTITPKDFETDAGLQKNDIVLVLDVSGSMGDGIDEECTNPRVRHKVDGHYEWDIFHPFGYWVNTYYIDDYCEEHQTSGEHKSTKINELKKAANSFIDKMTDYPKLKVGIVTFSDKAVINTDSNNNFFSNDSNSLHTIINNLKASGGTNTGEGLRKAEYILEKGESDANKSIVFMSDGMPTFYSVSGSGRDKSDYTVIDNNDPSNAGNGHDTDSDNVAKSKSYAIEIGNIIRNTKKPKIFSIGYGLGNASSTGNINMKDIHKSMGGTDECFFATDVGAIDGVFNSIADEIIQSYNINDLTMNMNFSSNDGFALKGGGNTVKFGNITYSGTKGDNKYLYHANPLQFSFVINGSKLGEYNNVFGNSNVIYTWNNSQQSAGVDQNNLIIRIVGANNVKHGLYKGMNSITNEPDIDDTITTFAKGATISLGASADGVTNGNKVTLNVANGVNIVGDIKVYEISNTGSLAPIGNMFGQNGVYNYTVSNLSSPMGRILILYNEKVPKVEGNYTNPITVQSASKSATVTVGSAPLPDLF